MAEINDLVELGPSATVDEFYDDYCTGSITSACRGAAAYHRRHGRRGRRCCSAAALPRSRPDIAILRLSRGRPKAATTSAATATAHR
jgi:hypothetical protein